ncbi:YiiD C-terminal domain-containing protein [Luteimonas vadosa]|uniref:YiiD C-terminal domain-containing protein n=1 Tax=Luteimonas vadosa TaxID=1165507 RepID=A0ABP9DYA6_9GAMM
MSPSGIARYINGYLQAMPPVAAMDLRFGGYEDGVLTLEAPLATHVNDKGCAFGGSLVSMMTLAGWGVVMLRLQEAGIAADVFVADSEVKYLAPLFDDLVADARVADDADWDGFVSRLRERGRASLPLLAGVRLPAGGVAAECRSRYVAVAKG